MTERVSVAVDIDGTTHPAGTLHVTTRRTLTSTFAYQSDYIEGPDGYALDPQLPLREGATGTAGLPGAFSGAAPDRWGRNLIRKRITQTGGLGGREITELDYLLGVSDATRQGAVRFARSAEGPFLAEHADVPQLVALPRLLRAAEAVARDDDGWEEVKALLDAGTGSLGGARPKASVAEGEHLAIAKFPHPADEWDVMVWEATALDLAHRCGVDVPVRRVVRVGGRTALVLRRFDRTGVERVGYLSAMSLLSAQDGDSRDYLEVAEALAEGAASARSDLAQLWRRVAFSIAINNTDDHLRNHGFLRDRAGWRLAPAFDINPNPHRARRATSILGAVDREDCRDALIEAAPAFGLGRDTANQILSEVSRGVADWAAVARSHGVRASEVTLMAYAFGESEQHAG